MQPCGITETPTSRFDGLYILSLSDGKQMLLSDSLISALYNLPHGYQFQRTVPQRRKIFNDAPQYQLYPPYAELRSLDSFTAHIC